MTGPPKSSIPIPNLLANYLYRYVPTAQLPLVTATVYASFLANFLILKGTTPGSWRLPISLIAETSDFNFSYPLFSGRMLASVQRSVIGIGDLRSFHRCFAVISVEADYTAMLDYFRINFECGRMRSEFVALTLIVEPHHFC